MHWLSKSPRFYFQFLCAALAALVPTFALSFQEDELTFDKNVFLPLPARSMVQGAIASGTTIGSAESLIPLYSLSENMLTFADVSGQYGSHDTGAASAGFGLRYLSNRNKMYGAYLFGDFSQTRGNGDFFVVNPGFEVMSPHWDGHVNGYFPTTRRKKIKDFGFESSLGNYDYLSFNGHTEFDQQLRQYGVVGDGVDAEVGYSFSW